MTFNLQQVLIPRHWVYKDALFESKQQNIRRGKHVEYNER